VGLIADKLHAALQTLVDKYPAILDQVRGKGLMIGVRCHGADTNSKIMLLAREQKLLVTKAGDNVLRLLPPLIIDQSHIAEAVDKLDKAIAAYQASN
jgi:acetylornithine/N-succinyldiaminopimelate aminotransferase